MDRSFFRFVTFHAFDRQTDRRTDRILIAKPRLHCMQRGKKTRCCSHDRFQLKRKTRHGVLGVTLFLTFKQIFNTETVSSTKPCTLGILGSSNWLQQRCNIHRVRKKGATLFFAITLPNLNRSSKFFYRHTQQ